MEKYDKQRLNEYVKELLNLCNLKSIECDDLSFTGYIGVSIDKEYIQTYLGEYNFKCNSLDKKNLILPIWELIEKVKNI
jgi:hypothetical protein